MKTNREITQEYPTASGLMLTVPAGVEVMFVEGNGGGYAVKNTADLIKAGAWEHDTQHRYFYVPADAVTDLPANAKHIRGPIALKSDNWQDTSDHWLVDINGQKFDYYTGTGHRKISPTQRECKTIAEAAECTFKEWCGNFGYDTDSRKALETYHACQANTEKLRKAKVDIAAERERLADY